MPWIDSFLSGLGKRPLQLGRLYRVGDVHDRDDPLRQMAERVEAETEPSSFDNAACIFEQILLRLLDGGAGAFLSRRLLRCPSRGRKFVSADNGGPNQ